MKYTWTTLLGVLYIITESQAATSCSSTLDNTNCVTPVRQLLLDQSAFWFGTSYTTTCPQRQDGRLQCVNRHSDRTDSLLSRMTGQYALDPSYMSFVVNVTHVIPSQRTYDGCGVKVTAPRITSDSFTVDPLNTTQYHPFDVRAQPEVTWPSQISATYTVVFYDASFFQINALYVNIHGGSTAAGQAVYNYTGPLNLLPRESPYVWVVFEQQGPLRESEISDYIATSMRDNANSVYLDAFVTRFGLLGPHGASILRLTTDEYAAVVAMDTGLVNRCPIYNGQWLDQYFKNLGGVSYLPSPLQLSISVKLNYTVPYTDFTACCIRHQTTATTAVVDYRSNGNNGSLAYNRTPEVTLMTSQNPNQTAQTLANKMYTLLFLDVTADLRRTTNNALVHWMIVNIHGATVTSGHEVLPYLGPMSHLADSPYLVMLLEQTTVVNTSSLVGFFGMQCEGVMTGRCQFRAGDFIRNNSLSVVGMRLLNYSADPYTHYLRYEVYNITDINTECKGQPGYKIPCPLNHNPKLIQHPYLFVLIVVVCVSAAKK